MESHIHKILIVSECMVLQVYPEKSAFRMYRTVNGSVKFMTVHTPRSRPRTSPGQPLGISWSSQVFPGSSPAPNTPHLRHPQKRLNQSWYGVCVWRMSLSLACVSRPRVFPQSSLSLPFRAARPPASSPGVPNFHRLTPVSVIGGCPGVVTEGWGPS